MLPQSAERKSVVFSWDLKDAAESIERRLGLSEFQADGTETEKARDIQFLRAFHLEFATNTKFHVNL